MLWERSLVRLKDLLRPLAGPRVPREVAARFAPIQAEGLARIEGALRHHYFAAPSPGPGGSSYLSTEEGQQDLKDHLQARLENFRRYVVPWLAAHTPLAGRRVLEVGSGTGSFTVALAEQGALVTAVDVAEGSLEVARQRCAAYGVTRRN